MNTKERKGKAERKSKEGKKRGGKKRKKEKDCRRKVEAHSKGYTEI